MSTANLPWMSPEAMFQASGATDKADVWALGCCVYGLATRRFDDIRTAYLFERAVVCGGPAAFFQAVEDDAKAYGYSARFATLLASLLHVDPRARPTPTECLLMICHDSEGNFRAR